MVTAPDKACLAPSLLVMELTSTQRERAATAGSVEPPRNPSATRPRIHTNQHSWAPSITLRRGDKCSRAKNARECAPQQKHSSHLRGAGAAEQGAAPRAAPAARRALAASERVRAAGARGGGAPFGSALGPGSAAAAARRGRVRASGEVWGRGGRWKTGPRPPARGCAPTAAEAQARRRGRDARARAGRLRIKRRWVGARAVRRPCALEKQGRPRGPICDL